MQIPDNVVLATLDVSSLYTNVPQEERIDVVCRHYEDHYEQKLPITSDLPVLMRLILRENSFKFDEKHLVQTHSTVFHETTYLPFLPDFSLARVPSLK